MQNGVQQAYQYQFVGLRAKDNVVQDGLGRPKEAKEDEKKRLQVAFAIIDRHRLVSQSSDRRNERS